MTSLTHGIEGVLEARVHGLDEHGDLLVTWGDETTPRAARRVWSAGEPDWSRCLGLRGLIVFEREDRERPVWLGLLQAPPPEALVAQPARAPRSVHLRSTEELILECGKAKVALRADGRVTILGGYVLSRSTGVNKVKGASVEIN